MGGVGACAFPFWVHHVSEIPETFDMRFHPSLFFPYGHGKTRAPTLISHNAVERPCCSDCSHLLHTPVPHPSTTSRHPSVHPRPLQHPICPSVSAAPMRWRGYLFLAVAMAAASAAVASVTSGCAGAAAATEANAFFTIAGSSTGADGCYVMFYDPGNTRAQTCSTAVGQCRRLHAPVKYGRDRAPETT